MWVRLSRVGNVFTGYVSTDGSTWTQVSSVTIALPTTLDLGLGVASNNTTQTTTAQLRGYGNTTVAPATPATPGNFTAAGASSGVQLSWSADALSNLAGYNVYRSTSTTGTFTLLNSTPITSTSYLDSTAPAGVASYYELTAVASSNGAESAAATASGTPTAAPVTPATPTNFTATGQTGGVQLSWSADASSNLAGYNVYRGTSATGTFTLLNSTPITTTTYLDSSAPTGVVSYYRLTAVASSNGAESTPATANATATAPATSLTSVDIDASVAGSTTVLDSSDYNVTAGGPGVGGSDDGFRFLYTQVTGNFDVKVQVASLTVAGNFSTAGIMARSSLDADSPMVYMSASPANYRFKDRTTTAAAATVYATGTTNYSTGVWVRLTRVGNLFTAYTSTNGVTWTQNATSTIAMGNTLYLGLGVASNDTTGHDDVAAAELREHVILSPRKRQATKGGEDGLVG